MENKTNAAINWKLLTEAHYGCYRTIGANNSHFETKVTYISAGVIVLSFAFIKDNSFHCECLFILGNVFAGLALIVNLASYFYSNKLLEKDADSFYQLRTSTDIDKAPMEPYVYNKNKETNRRIRSFNYATLAILGVGIILLAIFFFINI